MDMKNVVAIASMAFAGCKSANFINMKLEDILYDVDAFKGYEALVTCLLWKAFICSAIW